MKAFIVQINGPEDVLKIQDLLAQAIREDAIKEAHGIGCACENGTCTKRVQIHRTKKGDIVLHIYRGADILGGITLSREGAKELAEELLDARQGV